MNLKTYFKSRYFIIPLLILLAFAVFNSYCYFNCAYQDYNYYINNYTKVTFNQFLPLLGFNRFSFFTNFFLYNYTGDIFSFLIPGIVVYSGISLTNDKLNGSTLKDTLLRKDYKKMMIKELFGSYIKAYLPFFITMIIVLIVGCVFFPTTTYYIESNGHRYDVFKGVFANPYIDIAFAFLWMFLYCIIEVNFSYIVMYKVKNIYGNIIVTLVTMIASLYISGTFISTHLSPFLFVDFNQYFDNTISSIFYIVLTSIPLYFLYRNKERVVRNFE